MKCNYLISLETEMYVVFVKRINHVFFLTKVADIRQTDAF